MIFQKSILDQKHVFYSLRGDLQNEFLNEFFNI